MSGATLCIDRLRDLLPADWNARIQRVRLEMTPHRAFRFVLLDTEGAPAAVGQLDEAAQRCLPPMPESLSGSLRTLLPQPIFQGEFEGRPLCVRPYFVGRSFDADLRSSTPAELMRSAETLLAKIQAERRSHRVFDEAEFDRFVRTPLQWIRACARYRPEHDARLDAWADAARLLSGQKLDYALHHGDFQFSNLLRAADGSFQIIDWELSQGEAPVWMDRAHLAIAYEATRSGCSYGAAAGGIRSALASEGSPLPFAFASEARSLNAELRRATFLLCVLHGMSHFLRRVPHLSDDRRIEDFLSAGDSFLEL